MAGHEASAVLNLQAVQRLYAHVWEFALRPSLNVQQVRFGSIFLIAFAALYVLDILFGAMVGIASIVIESATGYQFPEVAAGDWNILVVIVIAPVVEELLFRGWLRGDVAALRFALCGWAAFLIGGLAGETVNGWVSFLALGILMAGGAQWLATHKRDTHVPAWFEANFRWMVWGSTLAFGAIHLFNYEELSGPLDLLAVASQTMGGLVLAYTRLHLGLSAAIAQHAAFNLTILGIIMVFPETG